MNGTAAGLRRSAGIGAGAEVAVATLVVYKDDAGYGMKVSGDNPVFVVSVKAGELLLYILLLIIVIFLNWKKYFLIMVICCLFLAARALRERTIEIERASPLFVLAQGERIFSC